MIMRSVVVALALLAGAKVYTQDKIYRSATEDALIHAYRAKAVDMCQRATTAESAVSPSDGARRALSHAWGKPASLRLVIGNSDVDVRIWEIDHAAWAMRFKYPYVVLEAGEPTPFARCSYDVMLDRASITAL